MKPLAWFRTTFAEVDSRALRRATYVLIAACGASSLLFYPLPMMQLPQFEAMSRILWGLKDPVLGFSSYYRIDPTRGLSVLPLLLWGALGELLSWSIATRIMACLSAVLAPLGLCAVLRALDKPVLLALLGLPMMYGCSFYLGLVPSSISVGLALFVIAGMVRRVAQGDGGRAIFFISCLLPLTHPFGVVIALTFAVCLSITATNSREVIRTLALPLLPVIIGAILWVFCAVRADGVAGYDYPSLLVRLFWAPQQLIGGFVGQGEAWLLTAQFTIWIWLSRSGWPWCSARRDQLSHTVAASWLFWVLCVLGYVALPSSTSSTFAIHSRVGSLACLWLPVLVSVGSIRSAGARSAWLLFALGLGTGWYTSTHLAQFAAEAAPLRNVLAHVRARPKMIWLTYDHQGHVARSNSYVYAAAYAQAEHGGALALSFVDYGWTVPLRRRDDSSQPKPVYGSEWDPALLYAQPALFLLFYDTVLVIGREPSDMTIFMHSEFRLIANSHGFLLYHRDSP